MGCSQVVRQGVLAPDSQVRSLLPQPISARMRHGIASYVTLVEGSTHVRYGVDGSRNEEKRGLHDVTDTVMFLADSHSIPEYGQHRKVSGRLSPQFTSRLFFDLER